MKTFVRNFISLVRRFQMAFFLNLIGLSVALAVFMVILMQVNYDFTFDRFHKDCDHIYRAEVVFLGETNTYQSVMSRPMARTIMNASPHVQVGCILSGFPSRKFFVVEDNGVRKGFKEFSTTATADFLRVFSFDMLYGDDRALTRPHTVILPASLAEKFFGTTNVVGRELLCPDRGPSVEITGVYRDFPKNSSLHNIIFLAMDESENYNVWTSQNYNCYIRVDDSADIDEILTISKKLINPDNFFNHIWGSTVDLHLARLSDLHFSPPMGFDSYPKASRQVILLLLSLAFIILVIAAINYTNFSTALIPMRIRSINTQKVFGASNTSLRLGLLLEGAVVSLIAFLISLYIVYLLGTTRLSSLFDVDLSLLHQLPIISLTAVIAVIVGVLAGIYPTFYITSFPPVMTLKGQFGLSADGRRLRNILVGIQYVSSFALIIAALFMYLQNYYIQHAPLGYDRDAIVTFEMSSTINENREAFISEMQQYGEVDGVTFSKNLLACEDVYMTYGRKLHDDNILFQCLPVAPNFLDVMGIEVTEGRSFRSEDMNREKGLYIFNEIARTTYDIQLGESIEGEQVIGFVSNIKYASFHKEVAPMAFYIWGKYMWGNQKVSYENAYVKLKHGSDLRTGIEHVRKTLKNFDMEYPFDVRFYDTVIQAAYDQELKTGRLITIFSVIAILISVVGVFGLVFFETEYRRKEIAVRRVLGATVGEILLRFNRSYVYIILICFVIGAPIAWISIGRWLENFAYRITLELWVPIVALLLVSAITLFTVSYRHWEVARENPVKNLRTE